MSAKYLPGHIGNLGIIYGWGGGRRENGGVTKKLGMTGVG